MPYEQSTTRVEVEMSLTWGEHQPALFVAQVSKFQAEHPNADWSHSLDLSRPGFVTLTANRRFTEWDNPDGPTAA